jgi:hypothetical protein
MALQRRIALRLGPPWTEGRRFNDDSSAAGTHAKMKFYVCRRSTWGGVMKVAFAIVSALTAVFFIVLAVIEVRDLVSHDGVSAIGPYATVSPTAASVTSPVAAPSTVAATTSTPTAITTSPSSPPEPAPQPTDSIRTKPMSPAITLSPSHGRIGSSIVVAGQEFPPSEKITFSIFNEETGSVFSNKSGAFSGTVTVVDTSVLEEIQHFCPAQQPLVAKATSTTLVGAPIEASATFTFDC